MQTTHFVNDSVFPRLSRTYDGWSKVTTSLDMGIIRWASGIPFSEEDCLIMFPRTFARSTYLRKGQENEQSPKYKQFKRAPKYNDRESCLSGVVVYFGCMYAVDFYPSLDIFKWRQCEKELITEYRVPFGAWEKYMEKYNTNPPEHMVKDGACQNTLCARILDHIIRISGHFKNTEIRRFYRSCQMIKTTQIRHIPVPSLCRDNIDDMATWMYALAALERTPWRKYENKYGETGEKKSIVLIGAAFPNYFQMSGQYGRIRCDYNYVVKTIGSDLTVNDVDFFYMARAVFHNIRSLRESADEQIEKLTKDH